MNLPKLSVLALFAALLTGCGTTAPADERRFYEIEIRNLTNGQPLSPAAIVTHTGQADVWQEGQAASAGVKLIAEMGEPGSLVAALRGAPGVDEALATSSRVGGDDPGIVDPNPQVFHISAAPGVDRISLVTMLACTNDGFTGLDSVALPEGSRMFETVAYQAGTEQDTERWPDLIDNCQKRGIGPVEALPLDGNANPREDGVIAKHPGVMGTADLDPAEHGWDVRGPVARITITRVGK